MFSIFPLVMIIICTRSMFHQYPWFMFCVLASISLHKPFVSFAFSSNHITTITSTIDFASQVHHYHPNSYYWFVASFSLINATDWFYCNLVFIQCAFECFKHLSLHVASRLESHMNLLALIIIIINYWYV